MDRESNVASESAKQQLCGRVSESKVQKLPLENLVPDSAVQRTVLPRRLEEFKGELQNNGNCKIICGHSRYQAALPLGWDTTACKVVYRVVTTTVLMQGSPRQ